MQNFMQHYCCKGTKEIVQGERIHTTQKPLIYVWLTACRYDCRRLQTWDVLTIFLVLKPCTLCYSLIKWRQYGSGCFRSNLNSDSLSGIFIFGLPTFPLSSLFPSACTHAPSLRGFHLCRC